MALQSDQEFAPTQIARAVFPTAFRGYDQDAVRRYLSRLASALEQHQEYPDFERLEARTPAHERVEKLEDEIDRLRLRNEELEADLARAIDEAMAAADRVDASPRSEAAAASSATVVDEEFDETRAIELLGKETARVLESARSAASDITKRAESSAETMRSEAERELSDARRDANALVAERQAEAEALVAKVAGEAEAAAARIKADAERHRATVLDESSKILVDAEADAEAEQQRAEERARQVVADAETLRQQVVSELVADRRQAQSELDRIKSSRDRLAMSLAVARAELDEVAEALEVATSPMSQPGGDPGDGPGGDDPGDKEVGGATADQVEVDRIIADLDAPSAAEAAAGATPKAEAGAGNGRGNRRSKSRNRKGAGKQAKGGAAKGANGNGTVGGAGEVAESDGFTVRDGASPSPTDPATGDASKTQAPAGAKADQPPAPTAESQIPARTDAPAPDAARSDQSPGPGPGQSQGKRSGRNRSGAKRARSAKSNGAPGRAGSGPEGSEDGGSGNGSGRNGGPSGNRTGKQRPKRESATVAAGEPLRIEDAPTAPIFEGVAGRFDELKGVSETPAVEPASSSANGKSGLATEDGPDEAKRPSDRDQADPGPTAEPVVIDLTDGSGGSSDIEIDIDIDIDIDAEREGGGLVTVIAVENSFENSFETETETETDGGPGTNGGPSGADAARADVSIRERSLVDGFTTIEVADADSDSDSDAETGRPRPAATPAPVPQSTKAELDADTDLGIDTGESRSDTDADGGPSVVRSVVVSEPSAPEQHITTVASRTASSQPDRTRGDLPMETPFAGRLPKEFAARDLALTRSGPNFRRQLRRALNDDQSDVLDRIRAGRGQIKVEELPAFGDQIDLYLAPLRRGLAEVAQSGAKAAGGNDLSPSALDNLVRQLARYVVDKVRVPTIQVIEQSADHDRERILEPIRALYREFRNVGLVDLADDALYEAFAIGLYDAIEPSAPVMWMVDPRCDPDPICEINRDRLDMARGDVFPSGHVRPLSLPGCRCLVTLAEY